MLNISVVKVAGIEKQLAEALEELDAAKEKIGRYEAAVEEDLSCDVCTLPAWQPCILPCGHSMCADCLYEDARHRRLSGRAIYSMKCGYCRSRITRAPIVSFDWQRRVDAMALEKGIPIPKRNPFKWPPAGTPKNHRSRIV
ncbi:hypothetical protein GGU10DRAFT_382581 [Lentinula aff. detonsa]|uniref:RING-type domain-containing protein n=1 Tax=Lentinula aff. detonsa TaxID=2804958 RepID=A0AA38NH33_9AGAR|nr:hypothetical protein GGU10DRAFT_382581 [Lentinula aff. detonsa]